MIKNCLGSLLGPIMESGESNRTSFNNNSIRSVPSFLSHTSQISQIDASQQILNDNANQTATHDCYDIELAPQSFQHKKLLNPHKFNNNLVLSAEI